MRALAKLFFTTLLLGIAASGQTSNTSQPQAISRPELTTGTQLVLLDVVVLDHDGHPVHGLKESDFQIVESKTPQDIKAFEEHIAPEQGYAKSLPSLHLPPGTFTDFVPVPEDSTLNILLLDTLNTPTKDQGYVRSQLQQYVNHANPGTRIAIFGLTHRLTLLQGFTSNPEVLKSVVDRKLIPRASVLLQDSSGSNADPIALADAMTVANANAVALAGMRQFEADNASYETQMRTRYTLEAFDQLARYLNTFTGRKNVIWFSGSFPLGIFPDPTLADPFSVQSDASDELRETTSLLQRARIAVYPIDARGLQSAPANDATRAGDGYVSDPSKFANDINSFNQTNTQEHITMSRIADDTGGHAFYNTNGLVDAVSKSIDAGSNYYTLSYAPANHDGEGEYRSIQIQLQGNLAARDLKLSYRHGYYAVDTSSHRAAPPSLLPGAASPNAAVAASPNISQYEVATMQRGAPAPSEILFKVSVLPDSTATQDTIGPHNEMNPNALVRGPFRLYDVHFAVLATGFVIPANPDGHHRGTVDFKAYVYDTDGKLLNIDSESLNMDLAPDTYARLMKSGLGFELQVSAPARSDSFIRIAVHDVSSGRFGVVEIPTVILSNLPPVTVPAAPVASPPAAK